MNLNTINKRLKQLEITAPTKDEVTLICYDAIPPIKTDTGISQGIPRKGVACVVVRGAWFSRKDYDSIPEYIDAVNQEHIRVHGEPCEIEVSE